MVQLQIAERALRGALRERCASPVWIAVQFACAVASVASGQPMAPDQEPAADAPEVGGDSPDIEGASQDSVQPSTPDAAAEAADAAEVPTNGQTDAVAGGSDEESRGSADAAAAARPPLGASVQSVQPRGTEAEASPNSPAMAVDPCANEVWELRGASARPNEATRLGPGWIDVIDRVKACLQARQEPRCILVEGHFDVSEDDPPDVIAAFGRYPNARRIRAEALAATVMKQLYEHGVASVGGKVFALPAKTERTFRGVAISLQDSCPADHDSLAGESYEEEQAIVGSPQPPDDAGHLSLAAMFLEHGAELTYSDGAAYTAVTGLGISIRPDRLYLDVSGGLTLSHDGARRAGFHARANLGYRALMEDLLRVGIAGGYHQGSYNVFDTWLSRSWWVGVHGAACWDLGVGPRNAWMFCAYSTVAPIGARAVRARVEDDRLLLLSKRSHYRFGWDLGARIEVSL